MKRLGIVLCLVFALCLCSCFYSKHHLSVNDVQGDDLINTSHVYVSRQYGVGYNFVVQSSSLLLNARKPSQNAFSFKTDSVFVCKGQELYVADFVSVPAWGADSIWVLLTDSAQQQGWVSEKMLIKSASPDDPISKSIYNIRFHRSKFVFFFIGFIAFVFLIRLAAWKRLSGTERCVKDESKHISCKHNYWHAITFIFLPADVFSFYPLFLRFLSAASGVYYSSLHLFAHDIWEEYYFHPTLNPFALEPLLGGFLLLLWLNIILLITTVDESLRQLSFKSALSFILYNVAAVGVLYQMFLYTTTSYVGYVLLFLYLVFCFYNYFTRLRPRYRCGKCGRVMHDKGKCPRCLMINE